MNADLLDHCARLLELEPTRCMDATLLHRRATLDTGFDIPYRVLLETLAAREDRFSVIPADDTLRGMTSGWSAEEQSDYRSALAASRDASTLVMLAQRQEADPTRPGMPEGDGDVLTMVHGTLIDLLRAGADDEGLREAASAGARQLEAVRNGLGRCGAGRVSPRPA